MGQPCSHMNIWAISSIIHTKPDQVLAIMTHYEQGEKSNRVFEGEIEEVHFVQIMKDSSGKYCLWVAYLQPTATTRAIPLGMLPTIILVAASLHWAHSQANCTAACRDAKHSEKQHIL